MTTQTQTKGQLERTLSQGIQALYRDQLGHQPSKITCQISDRNLVIVLENSITPAEQLLAQSGSQELAEKVRGELDEAIQPGLKELIESTLNVTVTELLSDATLDTGRTGIIAVLEESPSFRNSATTSKNKK